MRPKQPVAEPVDGRDPRAVERAREIGTAALDEARADPAAQLARRLLRVRDDEDGVDVDPLVAHRAREPLDEHTRLPGPGPRRDEHEPGRVDCALLLRVELELHARLTRHME